MSTEPSTNQPSCGLEGAPDAALAGLGMAEPAAPRVPSEHRVRRDLEALQRDLRSVERDVHLLALAGGARTQQRRQRAHRQQDRARLVGDRGARRRGRAAVVARLRHDAAHRLPHDVDARPARHRSQRAEAGRRAVDDGGVHGAQILVTQPEALHHAGAEVVDHHLHARDEALHDLDRARLLEVERDAALAAVVRDEVGDGAVAREDVAAALAVAPLDLDDLGAHVGHQRRGERPLLRPGEV